jgi:hypothetical protein
MATMTRKRLAWGTLWSEAPWDGQKKEPTPIQIPATAAAKIAVTVPVIIGAEKRVLRRMPLGKLLRTLPWAGRPNTPEPTANL